MQSQLQCRGYNELSALVISLSSLSVPPVPVWKTAWKDSLEPIQTKCSQGCAQWGWGGSSVSASLDKNSSTKPEQTCLVQHLLSAASGGPLGEKYEYMIIFQKYLSSFNDSSRSFRESFLCSDNCPTRWSCLLTLGGCVVVLFFFFETT